VVSFVYIVDSLKWYHSLDELWLCDASWASSMFIADILFREFDTIIIHRISIFSHPLAQYFCLNTLEDLIHCNQNWLQALRYIYLNIIWISNNVSSTRNFSSAPLFGANFSSTSCLFRRTILLISMSSGLHFDGRTWEMNSFQSFES